jgi:hypothetical protein
VRGARVAAICGTHGPRSAAGPRAGWQLQTGSGRAVRAAVSMFQRAMWLRVVKLLWTRCLSSSCSIPAPGWVEETFHAQNPCEACVRLTIPQVYQPVLITYIQWEIGMSMLSTSC